MSATTAVDAATPWLDMAQLAVAALSALGGVWLGKFLERSHQWERDWHDHRRQLMDALRAYTTSVGDMYGGVLQNVPRGMAVLGWRPDRQHLHEWSAEMGRLRATAETEWAVYRAAAKAPWALGTSLAEQADALRDALVSFAELVGDMALGQVPIADGRLETAVKSVHDRRRDLAEATLAHVEGMAPKRPAWWRRQGRP